MNPEDKHTTNQECSADPVPSHEPVETKPTESITRISDLQRMNIDQLNQFAKHIGLKSLGALTKSQVVFEVVKLLSEKPNETLFGEGVLEVLPDGFGFLRSPNYN